MPPEALAMQTFFDQHTFYGAAGGAGLHRDEIDAQHVRSDFRGFVGRVRELDAAGFAATASVNLRFDNDYVGFESGRAFAGFFLGKSHFATRSRDTVARENGFGLILMDLHRGPVVLEFWCRPKH
jgi:hypothetical protein